MRLPSVKDDQGRMSESDAAPLLRGGWVTVEER